MLLAAANINPHVELVGMDLDARCVKITSINLGLRSRYGYVVCGNALTGETQFAYRIGSFLHEGPNGLRRGVIRDVAPEETPVPVIAERLRSRTGDLLTQAENADAPTDDDAGSPTALPTIIEVPQWLNRLEPKLAALSSEERPRDAQNSEPAVKEEPPEPTAQKPDGPPTQRELF